MPQASECVAEKAQERKGNYEQRDNPKVWRQVRFSIEELGYERRGDG